MYDSFKAMGEEDGIEVVGAEHKADVGTMIDIGENLVASGVDCLMFQNFDPEGTEEVVKSWEEQGVRVISYDEYSDSASVNVRAANYECGYKIGTMAANWINENLADQDRVEVYIHGMYVEFLMERAKGIEDALKELAPTAVVVDRQDVLAADEPNTFENSLVAHPDIQVVCAIADTAAINICEWWISELKAQGADLSKYAGFGIDAVDTGLSLIAESRDDEAVFRGTIDTQLGGFMSHTSQKIWDTVKKLYDGEEVEDWYFDMVEVTEDNIDDYIDE